MLVVCVWFIAQGNPSLAYNAWGFEPLVLAEGKWEPPPTYKPPIQTNWTEWQEMARGHGQGPCPLGFPCAQAICSQVPQQPLPTGDGQFDAFLQAPLLLAPS